MTLLQWLRRYVNTRVDYPGGKAGSCVEAANSYLVEVLGERPALGDAASWVTLVRPAFVWEAKELSRFPRPGSVVVWGGASPVLGITRAGHLAVVLQADPAVLLAAEQGWAARDFLTVNVHSYDGVTGWLSLRDPGRVGYRLMPRPGAHGDIKSVPGGPLWTEGSLSAGR